MLVLYLITFVLSEVVNNRRHNQGHFQGICIQHDLPVITAIIYTINSH